MSNGQKDTIYIDIDDEITAVIDKLLGSPHKIVALVLPKRATVFQSIVNMKLLKRTADENKKNVVLVTSEAALMPLAGAVGLHVAKTPQSKPEIPPGPKDAPVPARDESEPLDQNAPVGTLAGLPEEDDNIQVDNTPEPAAAAAKSGKGGKAGKGGKGGKKLKIPNFESFRKRLLLGAIVLVVLIGGFILAFMVLPKAKVTLTTDTSSLDTDLSFAVDTEATDFDEQNSLLPGVAKEYRKTDTEKVAATGQKDLGTKATGSVSLKNCAQADGGLSIPAGTTVSTSNLAFVTNEAVALPASSFSGGGTCTTPSQSIAVTAQNAGEQYNVSSGRTFGVSGFSSVTGSNDNAMSGGTSKIVKIVSQQDVDSAKQKIVDRGNSEGPKEVQKQLEEENYYALTDTLISGSPTLTSSPNVGAEASEVTVTSTTAYNMIGVRADDLKKLIEADAKKKIDTGKQAIRDDGLDEATIRLKDRKNSLANLSLKTVVTAGPQLDDENIKKEIAGKKRGEAQEIIRRRPGIKDVEIAYSPFWVTSTPKNTSKIQIVFEQPKDNANDNNDQ